MDRAVTPAVEAVCFPAHLVPPGSPQAKQLHHLHAQLSLGQSCHRQKQKVLHLCAQGRLDCVLLFVACQPSLLCVCVGVFSRQEYWSLFAKTSCHTLLEHYISYYSSCQFPWVPGAARTPVTQAAAPPPHLALTGANPSPPGQPQELNPHVEVKRKPRLKPRGSVAKEEIQNLPISCTSHRLNPHNQLSRLCVYGIYKRPLRVHTKETTWIQDLASPNHQ